VLESEDVPSDVQRMHVANCRVYVQEGETIS